MIRFTTLAVLAIVMIAVFYFPSAVPVERFLDVLHQERDTATDLLGAEASNRILDRMLTMQEVAPKVAVPPPPTVNVVVAPGLNVNPGVAYAQMSERLFNNAYFRGIDALMVLASYRASVLIEILPIVAVFLAVALIDGFAIRRVREAEVKSHSAEVWAIAAAIAVALLGLIAVACFAPYVIPPPAFIATLLAVAGALGMAVANYHRIG